MAVIFLLSLVLLTTSSKKHVDSLHNVILFGIVGMFLGGNFQHGGNSGVIILQHVSNIIGNVLIDQNDTNILPYRGKVVKGLFDLLQFGVLLDNQEVGALRIAVSDTGQQKARDGVLCGCVRKQKNKRY